MARYNTRSAGPADEVPGLLPRRRRPPPPLVSSPPAPWLSDATLRFQGQRRPSPEPFQAPEIGSARPFRRPLGPPPSPTPPTASGAYHQYSTFFSVRPEDRDHFRAQATEDSTALDHILAGTVTHLPTDAELLEALAPPEPTDAPFDFQAFQRDLPPVRTAGHPQRLHTSAPLPNRYPIPRFCAYCGRLDHVATACPLLHGHPEVGLPYRPHLGEPPDYRHPRPSVALPAIPPPARKAVNYPTYQTGHCPEIHCRKFESALMLNGETHLAVQIELFGNSLTDNESNWFSYYRRQYPRATLPDLLSAFKRRYRVIKTDDQTYIQFRSLVQLP